MILRPKSDAELVDRAREILADGSIPLESRAMVVLLLLNSQLKVCPRKSEIADMIAGDGKRLTSQRLARMILDAEKAGYFIREIGHIDNRPGRWFRYWFIVGAKPEIRAFVEGAAR